MNKYIYQRAKPQGFFCIFYCFIWTRSSIKEIQISLFKETLSKFSLSGYMHTHIQICIKALMSLFFSYLSTV